MRLKYHCLFCGKKFKTVSWMEKHEAACEKRTDSPEHQEYYEKIYGAGASEEKRTKKKASHKGRHSKMGKFPCRIGCGDKFKSYYLRNKHEEICEGDEEEVDDCCRYCDGDYKNLPKHEKNCAENPANMPVSGTGFKKLRGARDTKIEKSLSFAQRYNFSTAKEMQIDMEKLERLLFAGWEVIAKDEERNCMIVRVPLEKA